jgi:hypothetical protein
MEENAMDDDDNGDMDDDKNDDAEGRYRAEVLLVHPGDSADAIMPHQDADDAEAAADASSHDDEQVEEEYVDVVHDAAVSPLETCSLGGCGGAVAVEDLRSGRLIV